MANNKIFIRQLFDEATWTYTYIVANKGEAVIIDTVYEQADRDSKLVHELGLTVKAIIDTHVHADHVTGAHQLREKFGNPKLVHIISKHSGMIEDDELPLQMVKEGDKYVPPSKTSSC